MYEENLPNTIGQFRPDLIITMSWTSDNDTIAKQNLLKKHIKSSGIPHIYWATEDPTHTETFTLPYITRVNPDFVFTICRSRVSEYKQLGIKAAHLDFGYHHSVNCPVQSPGACHYPIVVVANAYPNILSQYPHHYRHQSIYVLMRPLIERNIRIDLWGRDWDQMTEYLLHEVPKEWIHGYLDYTQTNRIYSSADITIGLQNYPLQVTQRTYEILASGGFLLTSDTPEIRRLFEPGRDLVTSSSPEETINLVNYYLQHPGEIEKIREQGRQAVQKDSYLFRAKYMISVLREYNIISDSSILRRELPNMSIAREFGLSCRKRYIRLPSM
jgi:spore maturation protein CgeB